MPGALQRDNRESHGTSTPGGRGREPNERERCRESDRAHDPRPDRAGLKQRTLPCNMVVQGVERCQAPYISSNISAILIITHLITNAVPEKERQGKTEKGNTQGWQEILSGREIGIEAPQRRKKNPVSAEVKHRTFLSSSSF